LFGSACDIIATQLLSHRHGCGLRFVACTAAATTTRSERTVACGHPDEKGGKKCKRLRVMM
jgi:hypothetical protein